LSGDRGISTDNTTYIPALGLDTLTPFYDRLIGIFIRDWEFKNSLIQQAAVQSGDRVLDLGCGTATLTLMLKSAVPGAEVTGLDGDQKVLEIARHKAEAAGLNIRLDLGMAYQLPYPDNSFDRVVSSLMIHHLALEDKERTFKEVYRVLRPGGEFHIGDIGRPRGLWAHLLAPLGKHLERAKENIEGRIPGLLSESGFEQVRESRYFGTLIGILSLYAAHKPVE
jgi:ubiquinone/menaquinone biosynthesis C-methylase UbiE